MNPVFLYAGQGSQQLGMGKDFYEEYDTFRELVDCLDEEGTLRNLMWEGTEEELALTENTQPCMALFAAGVTTLLKDAGIIPSAALGLSLGEYGALFVAEVFDAKDYVKMTAFRGRQMAKAAEGLSCSMSAILGASKETVEKACRDYEGEGYVTVANYNCPGQYVICGDEVAVSATEKTLAEAGAKKAVRLKVSGPFHTKFMEPAAERLKDYLDKVDFNSPTIPVALNVTGDFAKEDADLKANLVLQIQSGVHLEDELKAVLSQGYTDFIEIGPGNAVSGFLKKTARECGVSVNVITINTTEDFRKVTGELDG